MNQVDHLYENGSRRFRGEENSLTLMKDVYYDAFKFFNTTMIFLFSVFFYEMR